ncbi:MAG: hypothetical protein H6537_00045 [Bacteroidales bacterium]|nr:hypothetical protein [Bacteroidales bacterium]
MMKTVKILLPALLLFSLLSCEKDDSSETENCKSFNVSLMERDDYYIFDKTVILFDNENYLVKTPLAYFLSNLNSIFVDYDKYLSTVEKVVADGQTSNLLYASAYFDTGSLDFVIAAFLENGQCYVYNKITNKAVEQVFVEYWGCHSAPLAGAGGRRFYIENTLFLETTDWIS